MVREPVRTEHVLAARPRYAVVADDLIARIQAGEFPVGSVLPTELELAARYKISRHTIREALRRLDQAGLLSRRRRAGTQVVATTVETYRQPVSSIDDVLQYGATTEIRGKRQRVIACDAALAALLLCPVGRRWLRVESTRVEPGKPRPLCHTVLFLSMELDGIETKVAAYSGPMSAMLERSYGIRIARIEQTIQAVALEPGVARKLRAEPGAPALKAVRRYYDAAGKLLEVAVALHPGERFEYTTVLNRN